MNISRDQAEHTRRTRDAYDQLAAVWSATTDEGPFNGFLERPALRSLVPSRLTDAAVLDAGCGSGAQARWLLDQGADVVGIDLSPRMVEEATRRCGGQGRFFVADLAEPLPLEPRSLDGVTCSLALHYLHDWSVPLRSFASALRPDGWAVISLDHPFGAPLPTQRGGYFEPSWPRTPGGRAMSKFLRSSGVVHCRPHWARSLPQDSWLTALRSRSLRTKLSCASRMSWLAWSVCPSSLFTDSGFGLRGHLWVLGNHRDACSALSPWQEPIARRWGGPTCRSWRPHVTAVDRPVRRLMAR
jgi:SAM-dependent methyltransferase